MFIKIKGISRVFPTFLGKAEVTKSHIKRVLEVYFYGPLSDHFAWHLKSEVVTEGEFQLRVGWDC